MYSVCVCVCVCVCPHVYMYVLSYIDTFVHTYIFKGFGEFLSSFVFCHPFLLHLVYYIDEDH